MSKVYTGTPPVANVTPPHLYDISSLSILPIELQDIVFDFLTAIPCPSNTYTIVRLSKKHYYDFIHLLYKHIQVSDEAILRGLFNGLLDDVGGHTKGSLYHKRDLLNRCSSMVIASLYAWEAVKEAIQAWAMAVKNRRQETEGSVQQRLDGPFNRVFHMAFGPDCIEGVPQEGRGSKIGGNYQPHASFCFVGLSRKPLHPEAAPGTDDKLNTIVVSPGLGIKMMSDNVVTRFLPPADCNYPHSVGAGLEVLVGRDLLVVELLPVKMEETANDDKEGSVIHRPSGGHRNEDAVNAQIDYIVNYCLSTISGWDTETQEAFDLIPKAIIFTHFGSTIAPDGRVFFLTPSITKRVLQEARTLVRQRVREGLGVRAPGKAGMEDKIHVLRGYDECGYCLKASGKLRSERYSR